LKRLSSLGIIFLLLISTFLIPIPQDAQSFPISIISFQTDPSPVLVGQNFTYSIKVKNLDNKPIYVIPISRESFDPPDSVNIVKDYRPFISVLPEKLDPGEVATVGPHAFFSARRAGEVRITVYVSWSYSEEGLTYEASETFSFGIAIDLFILPEITFLTEPPDVGSITFSGTTYTNGQSGEYTAGTYRIEANVPKGYIFYNWVTTGGVSVANSESQQTIASVTGSGSLIAVFKWFVKLRGTVISHVQYPSGWPAVVVKVEELLLDTSNRLKIGEVVEVYRETPFTEISDGDRVEVYGLGFWIGNPPGGPYVEHGIVIKSLEHYIKKIKKAEAEVKVRGHIISEPQRVTWSSGDVWWFDIMIGDVLLDPTESLHVGDKVFVEIWLHEGARLIGFPETGPKIGDYVEVYGRYWGELWAEKPEHYARKITVAKWTVIAYLAFDNDLSPMLGWDDILGKFKRVGSTESVNLIVFRDYRGEDDSGIYYVMKDRYPYDWNVITLREGFEADTGAPRSLSDFLQFVKQKYPAEHYFLIIATHGSGFTMPGIDEHPPGALWIEELGKALKDANMKIDVLFTHSCLSGMVERGYEVSDYVNILVASEEIFPGIGSRLHPLLSDFGPYDKILSNLVNNPSMTPRELATLIVEEFSSWSEQYILLETDLLSAFRKYTYSAINLTKLPVFINILEDFFVTLKEKAGMYRGEIREVITRAERYDRDGVGDMADLFDFTQLISNTIPDDVIKQKAIGVYTYAVNNDLIINVRNGPDHMHSHGLSIFLPVDGERVLEMRHAYLKTRFAMDTSWDEFLKEFYELPDIYVYGGIEDYKPLKVFYRGSKIYVDWQNPSGREYTFQFLWWIDLNDNLKVDEEDFWKPVYSFSQSSSEFYQVIPEDIPIGLYKLSIDEVKYESNLFFVIFKPSTELPESDTKNYLKAGETGCRVGQRGCFKVKTSHYSEDVMITMASASLHGRYVPQDEEKALEAFMYWIHIHTTKPEDNVNPPSDIIEYIHKIRSGEKPYADCDGMSGFLIALARASGIPAREITGRGIDDEGKSWAHAWVEAYYKGLWMVWDPAKNLQYKNDYKGYVEELKKGDLKELWEVWDELNVDRRTDYGVKIPGDINGDGIVDYKDLARLAAAYGKGKGDPGFDINVDLNGDGIIDYKDLAILAANYGGGRP
jgi:hypothetical protein